MSEPPSFDHFERMYARILRRARVIEAANEMDSVFPRIVPKVPMVSREDCPYRLEACRKLGFLDQDQNVWMEKLRRFKPIGKYTFYIDEEAIDSDLVFLFELEDDQIAFLMLMS